VSRKFKGLDYLTIRHLSKNQIGDAFVMFNLIRLIALSAIMCAWFIFADGKSSWIKFAGLVAILSINELVKYHVGKG
jgi:hypothetical protein